MENIITRWWWIRYAPVVVAGGKIYGQRDLPADTSDKRVFSFLANTIPPSSTWITTPLQRTTQTADAISNAIGTTPAYNVESAFMEQDFGSWQGMTWDELREKDVDNFHRFWIAPADETAPGGESFVDLMKRVYPAIDRLNKAYKKDNIIVIAHGGSIRAAIAHALKLSPESALAIKIDNCSVSVIEHIEGPGKGGEWRVNTINSHLNFYKT